MVESGDGQGRDVIRVGTKVELWRDGGPVGWGQVTELLSERQVVIRRFDEDETYACDVEDGGVYVDDWSPQVRALMREREKLDTEPAAVEFYDVKGVGQVRVGSKLELWGDDAPTAWGEVTQLLAGRRVAVYWYDEGDTFISDVEEGGGDVYVDDWSPEAYALIAERAKVESKGHGQA